MGRPRKQPTAERDRRIADRAMPRQVAPLQSPLPRHPAFTRQPTCLSDIAAIPQEKRTASDAIRHETTRRTSLVCAPVAGRHRGSANWKMRCMLRQRRVNDEWDASCRPGCITSILRATAYGSLLRSRPARPTAWLSPVCCLPFRLRSKNRCSC